MPKPQIILISSRCLFNPECISPVEGLSLPDSSELRSILLNNLLDNISKIKSEYSLKLFLNNKDQNYISGEISDPIFFDPSMGLKQLTSYIKKKNDKGTLQFIILFADTIGFSGREYDKIINYLNFDDNTLVVGYSPDDKISLIAFNYFDESMFDKMYELNPVKSDFLKRINFLDYYVYIHKGYPFISVLEDFRTLYRILSTKESIEFCSHEIHEQFTHLFIEYKELLK